ncbi:MAG: TraR/DksA C4-type zinc finger protein [Patescibacteria group bacterium]
MLNTEQKNEFKIRLEKERDLLQKELASLGKRNPSNPADWEPATEVGEFGADRNDNADIIEALHENNAAINELEVRLQSVNEALERIQADTFGICEVSGEEIEMDRLNANPAARTCIAHMQ